MCSQYNTNTYIKHFEIGVNLVHFFLTISNFRAYAIYLEDFGPVQKSIHSNIPFPRFLIFLMVRQQAISIVIGTEIIAAQSTPPKKSSFLLIISIDFDQSKTVMQLCCFPKSSVTEKNVG